MEKLLTVTFTYLGIYSTSKITNSDTAKDTMMSCTKILVCVCKEAYDNCEDRCSRWRGKRKPDKVYKYEKWKKYKPSVKAAIDYEDSLD
jgi:hypothetical protein